MYHFLDPVTSFHLFTYDDPRNDGFPGVVQDGVELEVPEGLNDRPAGAPRPQICLGLSFENGKHYRVFRSATACQDAGYQTLGPNYNNCWCGRYRVKALESHQRQS